MSGLINKIKEAVHSDKTDNHATDNPQSTNAGPHKSNMANTVDPRVDSDRDNYSSGAGVTGSHGTHGTTGTHGSSGLTGSHGTHGGIGSNTHGSSNAGPHSSNFANSADPRVDSDRDGRGLGHGNAGTSAGLGSNTHGSSGLTGSHGTTGGIGSNTHGSSNAGPHSSNFANSADPRVDSDRDGRGLGHGTAGTSAGLGSNTHGSSGLTGSHGTTGGIGSNTHGSSGLTGSHGTTGGFGSNTHGSTTAGPHSSNIANKADPRVDSDLDGGRNTGFGTSGTGHATQSGYGTAGSGLASHGAGSHTAGSGDATKTAGPHNSDLMNKLDPRVDSDMSGGKTYGGNATHQ